MVWIEFVVSALLIVYVAIKLAEYGDALAARTGLGGLFVGTLLIAGTTSLPEVLTSISSLQLGEPNLAAGNLFGSNMFNMFLLAVVDMVNHRKRILRGAAMKHALTGSLTILLISFAVFFILADIDLSLGWVGLDSIALMLLYVLAVRLIYHQTPQPGPGHAAPPIPDSVPKLGVAIFGFALAAAGLIFITPWMVRTSNDIATITGLGTTFIGTTLVALVTSLPELVTTITAIRLGAADMAVGNLFGSNMFNMFALGLTDVFFTQGRFLSVVDPAFLVIASLGLIMTGMALIGNLARLERRVLFIELDALALVLVYFGGIWLLYTRGIAP
ncbi:MAG: sodium:calcium antiporter [Anaerolineaceae bacterium]|nr:sodium:calcium antiporter [Anaerolineaceae bacterium]